MKILSLIVLVLSFTFAAPAMARDKDEMYTSIGDKSCGTWVKARKGDDWKHTTNINWIAGFITSYNAHVPDVHNILGDSDLESVYLWIDKYCQENPLSHLADGMIRLSFELWPNRKRTADD